jgi:subtilisin-like proprotein convertase family protein
MRQIVHTLLVFFGLGLQMASADAFWEGENWTNISFSAGLNVPDNNEFGVTFEESTVGAGFTNNVFGDIVVHLVLSGNPLAFNGDLFVTLASSAGGYAVLLNRVGRTDTNLPGYSDNGFQITFTLGGDDIHLYHSYSPGFDGQGRLTGEWGVDGRSIDPDEYVGWDGAIRSNMLESFQYKDPNATWTLFVADLSAGGEVTVESWGIGLEIIPEPGTGSFILLGFLLLHRRIFRRSLPSS